MRSSFSVAMCVYGGDDPRHFQEAVRSVWAQSVCPSELVLVVDGPISDALETLISDFEADTRFRVIRFSENRGHGAARRAGIEACSNELIALMDADDLCAPERFALQLAAFDAQPDMAVIGGQIEEFIDDPQQPVGKRTVPLHNAEIKEYMKTRCPMNQVAVMLRKSCVLAAGGYLDWYCNEDYYLWIRMADMPFANLPQTLVHVRISAATYGRRGGWRYFRSEQRLQKYMRRQGLISLSRYCSNVLKRLILQVLMPNWLRGWVFRRFARD